MSKERLIIYLIPLIFTICCCVYLFWHILYGSNYTHDIYEINISRRCISNDSVGDDWHEYYYLNDKMIPKYEKITVPINTTPAITFKATLFEYDEYGDTASKSVMLKLKDNSTYSFYVIAEENMGQFKGNIAKWEISVSVNKIGKC